MAACGTSRQAMLTPAGGRQASVPAPALPPSRRVALFPAVAAPSRGVPACCALQREREPAAAQQQGEGAATSRREALALGLAAAAASLLVGPAPSAQAIQGLTAGRVPGAVRPRCRL